MAEKQPICFLGFGGFAGELLADWNNFGLSEVYRFDGFFDDDTAKNRMTGYRGTLADCFRLPAGTALLLTFTDTRAKFRLLPHLTSAHFVFPNLIHRQASLTSPDIRLGQGNIVSAGCILTNRVVIGDFNAFNHYVTVGHDCIIGNGNTFMTKAHLSGHSRVGNYNSLGVGATVLPGKKLGNGNKLAPQATLMHTAGDNGYYAGTPALRYDEQQSAV